MQPFAKILDLCLALSTDLQDVVFIGGVAVYLHSVKKAKSSVPPEASHDADFVVSISDYSVLKDEAEITYTPRLAKHQMVVDEVEFDVYVERLNKLIVPYDEVAFHATKVEGIKVACLEHLLALKLEAFADRGHTSKGDKDRRDVAKIGLMLGTRAKKSLLEPYLRPELTELLETVARGPVFHELCSKNSHEAKKTRATFASFVKSLG